MLTSLDSVCARIPLVVLRMAMGCFMFYAGFSKIINPDWSAAGYLSHAQTFPAFFQWFARPENLPWVNFLNEWGLLLVGVALLFGVLVKIASISGILLMLLYYFPVLSFPYAGEYSFLVDDHIVFAIVFFLLIATRAGEWYGGDRYIVSSRFAQMKFMRKFF